MNHYETLGVKPSANPDEIRRAFRKLAVQFHPDRNPDDPKAEERYRAIAQAYETLSDPDRRRKYEQERTAPPAPEPNYPVADVSIELALDPHELRNGCDKTVTVSRPRTCPDCHGNGIFAQGVCGLCRGAGCQPCQFSGRKSCARCWGRGKDNELTTLVVRVPAACPPHGRKRFVAVGNLWGRPGPFYVWANVSVKVPRPGLIIR